MKGTSVVQRTKQDKLEALGAAFAIKYAKDNNDPLYSKYKKVRDIYLKIKMSILKKYITKGMMMARQAVSNND